MTQDKVMKLLDCQLNRKVEELLGNKVTEGYVFEQQQVPCPEHRPGCLVIHYGLVPRKVTDFAGNIAATWELEDHIKATGQQDEYTHYLSRVVSQSVCQKQYPDKPSDPWSILHASPRNRTRAFILTETNKE